MLIMCWYCIWCLIYKSASIEHACRRWLLHHSVCVCVCSLLHFLDGDEVWHRWWRWGADSGGFCGQKNESLGAEPGGEYLLLGMQLPPWEEKQTACHQTGTGKIPADLMYRSSYCVGICTAFHLELFACVMCLCWIRLNEEIPQRDFFLF